MKWKSPPSPGWLRASKGHVVNRLHRGQWVTSSWPRARGKARSPAQQRAQDDFALAAKLVKFRGPDEYFPALALTNGSLYMPRDLMTQAAFGRLSQIVFPDGTIMEGIRLAIPDAQLVLDQISMTPGTLIFRSTAGWVAIPPPIASAQVLTWQDASHIIWASGGGGGASSPDYNYPMIADFPTINGTPGQTDTAHGIGLNTTGASNVLQTIERPTAAGDWSMTARITSGQILDGASELGIYVTDTASGRLNTIGVQDINNAVPHEFQLAAKQWNDRTSRNMDYSGGKLVYQHVGWLRIAYTAGTNTCAFSASIDGEN